ncbi:MAG: hypothetical protein LUD14_06520 [Clostridiales bacterium]|nr:hypothetical protein [Clostridiales bacterium]
MRQLIYTVTAYFADPVSGVFNPFDEFEAASRKEAEDLRDRLLQDPDYERVEVSDCPEEIDCFD